MNKWIRWPGLIAFVLLFGTLFVFGYFFATSFVKNSIEDYGSEAVGAQVNVDSVNLTVSPLGMRVNRLQVTNPDAPMTNAVEIQGMAFELAFWNLLMGQVIIDEMSVDGIRFNTPRSSSGAIAKKAEPESKEPSLMDEIKGELPTADEIMARETLLTEVRSEELKTLYEQHSKILDESKTGLMDQKQLEAYQAEITKLTTEKLESLEDFNKRKERLSEINKELKKEKEKIAQAKSAYSTAYKELSEKLKEVKSAPSEDLANLKSKYSLDEGGATNITRLLFGNEAGEWTETGLAWYEKAKPYLEATQEEEVKEVERQGGRYIHFGGVESLPDFLLREARMDIVLAAGHLDGKLKDVTHQPEILGRPITLSINGTQLKGYDSMHLNAEFNHIDPKNAFDKAEFKVKKMEINQFKVSGNESFKLSLDKAKADITGTALIKNGKLKMKVDTLFSEAQFKSGATSGTAKQIGQLLETIHQFTITVNAKGNLKSLDTSFDSSLDSEMKKALNAKIDAKQAELEAQLKAKLQAKLTESTGSYSEDLNATLAGDGGLDAKQKQLEELAKAKLNSWEDQQKAELEAQKKAEKQKAKKEAEQKAKEKLKSLGF